MTPRGRRTRYILALMCTAGAGCRSAPAQGPAEAARDTTARRSRVAFAHELPRLNGAQLEVKIVEVTYGPGESSSPHTHPCPVIGYVTQGALRTQVKGEPEAIYGASGAR
jgi:quercetin dioxygenase-like cupin family protein